MASDVRPFVQQANLTRGRAEEQFDDAQADIDQPDETNFSHAANEVSDHAPTMHQPLPVASKWSSYDSTLVDAEQHKNHAMHGGFQLSQATALEETVTGEEDDEKFVTALPDTYAQRKGKRKRRGEGNSRTKRLSDGANREHYTCREDARLSPEDTVVEQGNWQRLSETNKLPSSKSRASRWGVVERNTGSKQSRRTNEPSQPERPKNTFDMGDGMFTSLGGDEAVEDEVHF